MFSGSNTKAAARAKAKGLKINTEITGNSAQDDDKFAQLATAPPRKQTFDAFEAVAEKRGLSKRTEALMNNNWRDNRRSQDSSEEHSTPLATAPPAKTAFSQEETQKPKPQLRVDTSLANDTGYRYANRHVVDPDLIFSAPATRDEFVDVLDKVEPQSASTDDGDLRDWQLVTSQHLPKPSYRRENPWAPTPTTHAGFDRIISWGPSHEEPYFSSSLSSPRPPVGYSEEHDLSFPLARIHVIKESKRLHTDEFDVDLALRKQLEQLVIPRSAGLPPNRLRIEYERGQEALARKAAHDESASKKKGGGQDGTEVLAPGQDNERFHALLGRLQKSAAHRFDKLRRKASKDSAISGLSDETESQKKANTLNPKAIEFCSTAFQPQPQPQRPATLDGGSPTRFNRPSVIEAIREPRPAPTHEDIEALRSQMEEIKAQLYAAQLDARRSAEQNVAHRFARVPQGNFGMQAPMQQALMMTGPAIEPQMGRFGEHQGLGGYPTAPPPGFGPMPSPPQVMSNGVPGMQLGPQSNTMAPSGPSSYAQPMPNGALNMNMPEPHTGVRAPMVDPAFAQAMAGNKYGNNYGSAMPASGYAGGQFNNQIPQMGAPGFPIANQSQPYNPPVGCLPGTTQFWAKTAFGPKPVPKPKGPLFPGDTSQCMKQQQYEEWLEHCRATDPAYAMKCKERQARRAARSQSQRSSGNDGGDSKTGHTGGEKADEKAGEKTDEKTDKKSDKEPVEMSDEEKTGHTDSEETEMNCDDQKNEETSEKA
ncbi:Uu.00g099400.m01.CDS01 [Anthostomella pinea]|uniref:Uu.00g099400.m01.CDS01 n=1 Tax=Anthostomella pinea TaxID=933095 RepID=A0AAI8YF47_9PEZI|nr:Uu.00g099400.m01.CDS01 [Anthostomella pinea]